MNAIGTLNIDNLTELDTLDCGYSNIATLNINKNTKLVCLRANGNFLEAIDVSNAPELNYLEVNNNSIDELDLSKNGKLVTLIANNNSLTSVDVAHMPELQVLRVAGNVIGTLNIDNNTKLLELDASKNIITNLNLANNKELSRLMLNGNKLTGLDVKGLNNLSYINIGDNKWDACTMNDFYYTLSPYKSMKATPPVTNCSQGVMLRKLTTMQNMQNLSWQLKRDGQSTTKATALVATWLM